MAITLVDSSVVGGAERHRSSVRHLSRTRVHPDPVKRPNLRAPARMEINAPTCRDLSKTVLSDMLQCPVLSLDVLLPHHLELEF